MFTTGSSLRFFWCSCSASVGWFPLHWATSGSFCLLGSGVKRVVLVEESIQISVKLQNSIMFLLLFLAIVPLFFCFGCYSL